MVRNVAQKRDKLTNSDVLLIGIWKSGGGDHFIDIEEAFAICWELAPHRFCWRTRNDLPNTKKLNLALSDFARKSAYPLVRQGSYKVRLSSAGLEWIKEHELLIDSFLGSETSKIEFSSNQTLRQLNRFKKNSIFLRWQTATISTIPKWELAIALRCASNSSASVWLQRIETLKADAQLSKDNDVLKFIDFILEKEPIWFKET